MRSKYFFRKMLRKSINETNAADLNAIAVSGGICEEIVGKGLCLNIFQVPRRRRTVSTRLKRARINDGNGGVVHLSEEMFEALFQLTKLNMEDMYKRCRGWGWDDFKKEKEFRHRDARFAVVSTTGVAGENEVVGFVHFRFEKDEDSEERQIYM